MINMVKELFSLLTPQQLKKFYILQLLVVATAFMELISIASIAPFMALVGNLDLLEENGILAQAYSISGLSNPLDFLFYTGLFVLLTLILSTLVSMFTIWQLSLYASKVGSELADRLYSHYMQKNWLFHASNSSSYLIKQVSSEAPRVTDQIIQPLMTVISKSILAFVISISILIYSPVISISGVIVFSLAYVSIYKIVHKKLIFNGQKMSSIMTERFRLMNEGFGGIKDILLLNRHHDFVKRFEDSGRDYAYARGTNIAIGLVPRYLMELIAFGAMILLVLLLIKSHNGDLSTVLPIISVFALAALKLLPALQQIYAGLSQMKGSAAAFEAIKYDLSKSMLEDPVKNEPLSAKKSPILLNKQISMENITFTYPGKSIPALNSITITIKANSLVGLVGSSGSGKSTAIDILLGLLPADKGRLVIDNTVIDSKNKLDWQRKIGFVPQNIFLSEGSIAENVAFGLSKDKIDLSKVTKALELANLKDVINELPDGINTTVGERGIQLSGGQRQRIGIARALYYDAEVLVFDEATSALDGITEKYIMDAIHDLNSTKTIVLIAHRLKTVQQCDNIYLMEKGRVIDQGTYSELLEHNTKFRKMALHS